MTSGKKSSTDVVEAIKLGASDYIIKPLDREIFKSKIKSLWTIEEKWFEYPVPDFQEKSCAIIYSNFKIQSINEIGISLNASKDLFIKDQIIRIDIPILKEKGFTKNIFKVKEIIDSENYTKYGLSYIGLEESDRKMIRLICRDFHNMSQVDTEIRKTA